MMRQYRCGCGNFLFKLVPPAEATFAVVDVYCRRCHGRVTVVVGGRDDGAVRAEAPDWKRPLAQRGSEVVRSGANAQVSAGRSSTPATEGGADERARAG